MNKLHTLREAATLIESGVKAVVAGPEELLSQLPKGNWIGGTIPYFMDEAGGCKATDRVFLSQLPATVTALSTRLYDEQALAGIAADEAENGFSFLIVPAMTGIHESFAKNVYGYEGIFNRPLLGWIAGVAVEDIGKATAKVYDGRTGEVSADKAVALHATLADGHQAEIGIVNLFGQGNGPTIEFGTTGFGVGEARVDGQAVNFAKWIAENKIDTRLPLVADYCGAMVNVSVASVDAEAGRVQLYAPVFPGVSYRIATPVADYPKAFADAIAPLAIEPALSLNCILNYLYGGLEGHHTGEFRGPFTFGEIAYGLLNQTLVHLQIHKV
ncbi:DUF6976 family protein [Derxia gummosa]|uniref:DUF6976 family protein n=1 Tax=Derxia gummosa DSM 723 TaxID=1121388 RepID=A0A8B6X749_9BURK|nr:hypothetical protein [Derxia gummosa]